MLKNITLNQYIAELQKLAAEHGDKTVNTLGSSCGRINGLTSPHVMYLGDENVCVYVPAYQHDVKEEA